MASCSAQSIVTFEAGFGEWFMSFRRSGEHERAHKAWVNANRELLLRAGIPLVAWESWRNWENFLYDDLGAADPSRFGVEHLSDAQAELLCAFLEAEEEQGRSGAVVLRQLQHRLARGPFARTAASPDETKARQ